MRARIWLFSLAAGAWKSRWPALGWFAVPIGERGVGGRLLRFATVVDLVGGENSNSGRGFVWMGRLVWHVVQRVAKALRWPRLFGVVVNQMFVFRAVCCCGGDGIWKLVFGQAKVRDIKMDGLPSRAAFERFLSSDQSKHVEILVSYVFSLVFPCVSFPCFLSSISYFPRLPSLSSFLSRSW